MTSAAICHKQKLDMGQTWNFCRRLVSQGIQTGKRRSNNIIKHAILLPKLLRKLVRKNCSGDREKLLKFEAEGQEFAKFLRSLKQYIQTVKGQNNFW